MEKFPFDMPGKRTKCSNCRFLPLLHYFNIFTLQEVVQSGLIQVTMVDVDLATLRCVGGELQQLYQKTVIIATSI